MTQASRRRRTQDILPEVCFKVFGLIWKGSLHHSVKVIIDPLNRTGLARLFIVSAKCLLFFGKIYSCRATQQGKQLVWEDIWPRGLFPQ